MKVLANDGISPSGEKILQQAGYIIETNNIAQEELIDYINENNIEVLLVRSATKVRKDLIDACSGLKGIGRGGVGMDNIDVDYARNQGKKVFNTPAASSQAVAEMVIAHMLSTARNLYDSNRQMPSKGASDFKVLKKKYGKGIELRGKTLGIIGMGRIGQATAKYALGMGMDVIGVNPSVKEVTIDVEVAKQTIAVPLTTVTLDDMLPKADFISLHIPAQADGKAILGAEEFAKMKDGVIVVNAARGGVIDENALIQAIENGKVRSAGVDVFVNEPTPDASVLRLENVSLTPHTGAATLEAQARIGEELAQFIMNNFPLT